jgi:hypothetical protein
VLSEPRQLQGYFSNIDVPRISISLLCISLLAIFSIYAGIDFMLSDVTCHIAGQKAEGANRGKHLLSFLCL